MTDDLKNTVRGLRTEIKALGDNVASLKHDSGFVPDEIERATYSPALSHSEMHANLMLAYRHLEDARMRLGKILQHAEGGVSCYDR